MDSFNSADPDHSVWQTGMTYHGIPYGVYSDSLSYSSNSLPSRTSDFTVATDSSNIDVGNAEIYGFVNTAPGGNAEINANGSVGDLDWVYAGTPGIEPGREADNMTAVFISKNLPVPITASQTNWWPVPTAPGGSTNIGGVTYSLLITNQPANSNLVYYSMGVLTQNIFIDASNVVLYLTNGMALSGPGRFTLNTNADVSVYSSGAMSMVGEASMTNLTGYARALSIYDVAGYTNLVFSFAGNFGPALIYAPETAITFSAPGGLSNYSFIGAIFCYGVQVRGRYSFHYDESLAGESFPILPAIIQQPTPQYAQAGSNVTFSVAATGSPTLTYQWYYQFIEFFGPSYAISGATNSSLIIPNPDPFISSYSVIVSNPYGSVASSEASLTVYSTAAATLSGTLNSTNGQFDLSVHNVGNVFGMPYVLQASTNLTDWAPILTNEAPFVYTDSNVLPQRYYRAVFVQ